VTRGRAAVALVLLVAAIGIGVFLLRGRVAPAPGPPPAPPTALALAEARVVRELGGLPEYAEKLGGLPEDERRTALQAIEVKGMGRLSDDALLQRAALVDQMLGSLDPETCGAIVQGRPTAEQLDRALASLGPSATQAWAELSFEAARAELLDAPGPPADPMAVRVAMITLGSRFPAAESKRLGAALASLGSLPPTDACWAGRTVYQQVHEIGAPHDRALARVLAQP
jgi:hypothetical protein